MQYLTGPPAVPALSADPVCTALGALASRGPAPTFHDGHLHPERNRGCERLGSYPSGEGEAKGR